MNFFRNTTGNNKNDDSKDVSYISKIISPMIDETAQTVFHEYNAVLMKEHITYIVYAVWGARVDGEITDVQKEINRKIVPVIRKIMNTLGIKDMTPQQRYAVEYLIRSLIIAKITYSIQLMRSMIEGFNGDHTEQESSPDKKIQWPKNLLDTFLGQDDLLWRKKFGNSQTDE